MLHEIATATRARGDLSRLWRCAWLTILLATAGVTQLVAMAPDQADPSREVSNFRFSWWKDRFSFEGPANSSGLFNVYKKVTGSMPVKDMGSCLYDRIGGSCNGYALPGEPRSGELWLIQVTAVFEDGEGPMGVGRHPTAACVCGLPPDPGPCEAHIPRWYRPLYGDRCQQFIWGGCFGNANNFESEEACDQACLETCVLPPHPSECCAFYPMWFYSPDTGRCEEFVSGGCVGYPLNAFSTREECETVCLPAD